MRHIAISAVSHYSKDMSANAKHPKDTVIGRVSLTVHRHPGMPLKGANRVICVDGEQVGFWDASSANGKANFSVQGRYKHGHEGADQMMIQLLQRLVEMGFITNAKTGE